MAPRTRLDSELVRRGLVRSRSDARTAIEQGRVAVQGMPASRTSTLVSPEAAITVSEPDARFVSRGGDKLCGALERMDVVVRDRKWLDVGASTGGFTDCLLTRGAAAVVAVDVGYGQLDWRLRNDARVVVMERTNARSITADDLPWSPDGIVADVSFISLTLLVDAFDAVSSPATDWVLMVKPQFEVGRGLVGKGGVVREPAHWLGAIERVVEAASARGMGLVSAAPSPLPGPAGNREFFLHLRAGGSADLAPAAAAVAEASRDDGAP
ncbi:MAG: TlyA family RNA methyltransferase [Actinomycetota bacterium]